MKEIIARRAMAFVVRSIAVILTFGLAASLFAQQRAVEEGPRRFCAVDIYLDSKGAPLAAYQIEFAVTNGAARIVGIEGGEHAAFRAPPHYDPKAIQNERAIIAAFTLAPANTLPSGRIRIATIHLVVFGKSWPEFDLKLHTAADNKGAKIPAELTRQTNEAK